MTEPISFPIHSIPVPKSRHRYSPPPRHDRLSTRVDNSNPEIDGLGRDPDDPIDAGGIAGLVAHVFLRHEFSAFQESAELIAKLPDPDARQLGWDELRHQAERTGLIDWHGSEVLRLNVQRVMRLTQESAT